MTLFETEFEAIAIERIRKFAKIAEAYNFEIKVGFSGGKDSQVVYDLCKRAGIEFKAFYNVAFESPVTKKFIKDNYPNVVWQKDHKFGFIENILKNHGGFLPTVESAYCCADFKHNPKYVDKCTILGVRKEESVKRAKRTVLSLKNKTTLKKMQNKISEYFIENCQSVGTSSIIQLLPIVDWSEEEVLNYIEKYNLPKNPEYQNVKRIGCMVCPKTNFSHNYKTLIKYPKLIDAFILIRKKSEKDWFIKTENKDYSDDKFYYICRWLNRSFRPFSKRQEKEYLLVKEAYINKKKQLK